MRPISLLKSFKKNINPPYTRRDIPSLIIFLLIFFALVLTVILLRSRTYTSIRAAGSTFLEAESSVLSGTIQIGSDTAASGGKYIQFGTL